MQIYYLEYHYSSSSILFAFPWENVVFSCSFQKSNLGGVGEMSKLIRLEIILKEKVRHVDTATCRFCNKFRKYNCFCAFNPERLLTSSFMYNYCIDADFPLWQLKWCSFSSIAHLKVTRHCFDKGNYPFVLRKPVVPVVKGPMKDVNVTRKASRCIKLWCLLCQMARTNHSLEAHSPFQASMSLTVTYGFLLQF